MNTPNKLTMLRIAMIPLVVLCLLWDFPYHYLVSLRVFSSAALTDFFDGNLARKNGIVTTFGKFLDPLADKLLIASVFICFVELDMLSAAVVVLVIAREFLVTSVRLIAADKGKVIAAGIWGKAKTVSQIVVCIYILLFLIVPEVIASGPMAVVYEVFYYVFVIAMVALTLLSGWFYLYDNREFIWNDR